MHLTYAFHFMYMGTDTENSSEMYITLHPPNLNTKDNYYVRDAYILAYWI